MDKVLNVKNILIECVEGDFTVIKKVILTKEQKETILKFLAEDNLVLEKVKDVTEWEEL